MWCRASVILIFRQQATLKMKKKKGLFTPHFVYCMHSINTSMFKVHFYSYPTINFDQNRVMYAIVRKQNSRKLAIIAFICLGTKSLEKPFCMSKPFPGTSINSSLSWRDCSPFHCESPFNSLSSLDFSVTIRLLDEKFNLTSKNLDTT